MVLNALLYDINKRGTINCSDKVLRFHKKFGRLIDTDNFNQSQELSVFLKKLF